MGPILVLAHVGDDTAAEVVVRLRRRVGPACVTVVTPEELVLAPGWSHTIDEAGARSRIRLADGEVLGDPEPVAVLDRLRFIAAPHFASAPDLDREYATTELHALLLSWLASLPCAVVNRPSPRGLGGADRSRLEWLRLANDAGFRVRATRATTNARDLGIASWPSRPSVGREAAGLEADVPDGHAAGAIPPRGRRPATFAEPLESGRARLLVVGDDVVGDPVFERIPPAMRDAALRLAAVSDSAVLAIELARVRQPAEGSTKEAAEWVVCGADPIPDVADPVGLEAIATLLLTPVAGASRVAPAPSATGS
jgi:hypothetical protein